MRAFLLCLASSLALASAFIPAPLSASRPSTALGAGSAYVSTKAGKAERIELYKQWLENAQLIFAIPGKDLTVAQVSALRKSMPEGTKVHVAKNTLLRVAIEGNDKWTSVQPVLERENLWFFVDEDVKGTFDAYAKFIKENKEKEATHGYKFGVFEGKFLDTAGLEAVSKLPSKDELLSQLVYMLKQPSTKLAQTLNEAPSKLGRAIKLSFAPEEGAEPAAETA